MKSYIPNLKAGKTIDIFLRDKEPSTQNYDIRASSSRRKKMHIK